MRSDKMEKEYLIEAKIFGSSIYSCFIKMDENDAILGGLAKEVSDIHKIFAPECQELDNALCVTGRRIR